MKRTLLTLMLFLMSLSGFGMDIASYRFATLDKRDDQSVVKVMRATVSDDRVLTVELSVATGDRPFFIGGDVITSTHEKVLNELVYDSIRSSVIAIANAPIKKQFSEIVCMMFAGPELSNNHLSIARDYDFKTKVFKRPMELVQGPQGCWVSHKVNFENERAAQQARGLKDALRVLALDFAGNF